jgi:hypothetical protein
MSDKEVGAQHNLLYKVNSLMLFWKNIICLSASPRCKWHNNQTQINSISEQRQQT